MNERQHERRERIAVAAMQGILSCNLMMDRINKSCSEEETTQDLVLPTVAGIAVKASDALIAALEAKQ